MSDLLQAGASWLADQLQANASETITYWRGSNYVSVQATLGSQMLRSTDRQGNTKMERTDRDFIIRAADLEAAFNAIGLSFDDPARGDQIDLTIGELTERFEVMATPNKSPWRKSDQFKLMVRIHTKFVRRRFHWDQCDLKWNEAHLTWN